MTFEQDYTHLIGFAQVQIKRMKYHLDEYDIVAFVFIEMNGKKYEREDAHNYILKEIRKQVSIDSKYVHETNVTSHYTFDDIQRTCIKCKQTKELAYFQRYFRNDLNKHTYNSYCIDCMRNYNKKWYAENKKAIGNQYILSKLNPVSQKLSSKINPICFMEVPQLIQRMKKLTTIALILFLFSCQKETTQPHITYWRCIHAVNKTTHKREYVGCCENGPTIDVYLAAKLKNYYTDPTEYNITTDSTACKNF